LKICFFFNKVKDNFSLKVCLPHKAQKLDENIFNFYK
jgi:hypothetical protein